MPTDPPPTLEQYRGRTLRDYLNALVSWDRRHQVVTDPSRGIIGQPTSGGLLLAAANSKNLGLRWGILPAGGIAAGGTGTVTLGSGDTPTAHNKWNTIAPAGRRCLLFTDEYGDLCVLIWDCA